MPAPFICSSTRSWRALQGLLQGKAEGKRERATSEHPGELSWDRQWRRPWLHVNFEKARQQLRLGPPRQHSAGGTQCACHAPRSASRHPGPLLCMLCSPQRVSEQLLQLRLAPLGDVLPQEVHLRGGRDQARRRGGQADEFSSRCGNGQGACWHASASHTSASHISRKTSADASLRGPSAVAHHLLKVVHAKQVALAALHDGHGHLAHGGDGRPEGRRCREGRAGIQQASKQTVAPGLAGW